MDKIGIVAGNWKMYKTPDEGREFVRNIQSLRLELDEVQVIFCPPFPALFNINEEMKDPSFALGAQNCHWEQEGAFTGEVSTGMLINCGVEYVILGHSERRHVFNEPDEWINNKVKAVLNAGLKPILCIGETLDARNSGETKDVLVSQLKNSLMNIDNLDNIVIAYEPVWAIGTGETATVAQVGESHKWVRDILSNMYSEKTAIAIPILYGGSVKPGNAEELFEVKNVNGFLIGGASLNVEPFKEIILTVEKQLRK